MSRYHPLHSIDAILQAAATWKEQAFGPNKSLFSKVVQSWTPEAFEDLIVNFVQNPDETDDKFWEKLHRQIKPASPQAKILMSEIIWLLMLFPLYSDWKPETKRKNIEAIYQSSGLTDPPPEELLTEQVLRGIGRCGQGYKNGLWRELRFAILMFKDLLEKSPEYRNKLFSDPWNWGEWLVSVQESNNRQFRHMISFLLFPDEYESSSSISDKRKILAIFTDADEKDLKKFELVVLDQKLFDLRNKLEQEYRTKDLSFYREPLASIWRDKKDESRRYWAGGFQWDEKSMLEEFKSNNYWRIGYDRHTTDPTGQTAWNRFEQIKPDDYFVIKGYGGSHDLKCHYYGKIVEIDDDDNLILEPIQVDTMYHGKAPSGAGAGNWLDTLLEVKRESDIKRLFFNAPLEPNTQSEKVGEDGFTMKKEIPGFSKNIILYGPPGTGKTHELLNGWLPKYRTIERTPKEKSEEALREFVASATWWEVIAYVMVDIGEDTIQVKDINEHPVLQMKASLSSNKNVKATVWGNLQMHTRTDSRTVNYTQRQSPAVFDKNEDSTWYLIEGWKDIIPDTAETIDSIRNIDSGTGKTISRYEFVTFHQSYGYEDFIEGLRPVKGEEGQITYEVKPGIFQKICNRAKLDPDNRYAIFIDEINRGNMSKIFGELITLIETDKRVRYDSKGKALPGEEKKVVTLPYSESHFGVPANLDIIGTMNTADRSIALLDIALRRRFEFKELMPDSSVISGDDGNGTIEGGAVDLRALLDVINRRIRLLAGRELQLGHAFFCPVKTLSDLHHCFAHKIIPLLQEYFYSHWERIQLVLGDQEDQLFAEHKADRQNYCLILSEKLDEIDVLGCDHDEHQSRMDYIINTRLYEKSLPKEAFTKIYRRKNDTEAGT